MKYLGHKALGGICKQCSCKILSQEINKAKLTNLYFRNTGNFNNGSPEEICQKPFQNCYINGNHFEIITEY